MLEITQAMTLNSGNPRISLFHHLGIVTCLRILHFKVLPSFITLPHSTWHQAHNQGVVQPYHIRVMGHCGKDTMSSKKVMVDLKCSALSNSPERGHDLQVHLKCHKHRLETLQSFGQHLPPRPNTDNVLGHQRATLLAYQQNDFSQIRNPGGQKLPGLWICPHVQWFLMTNSMQMMWVTIGQTGVGLKANPQSAWRKQNSTQSNFPKGWCSQTLVHSTSGRRYGWLGFWGRSIGPVFWNRTVCNSSGMEPQHWETAVAEVLETSKSWLPLKNFDNAEYIWRQWVEMLLKKHASEVQEVRKKRRRGNKQPVMELGECAGNKVRGKFPELQNTTFMVVTRQVLNGNNDQTSSMQLDAWYTDVRQWEYLIDFIEKNCRLKEIYSLVGLFKCNLMQEELDEEYMGLYAAGQMPYDSLYGQILYHSSLSNAFKLTLGHDVKQCLAEMHGGPEKDIAEQVMRATKVIPTSLVMGSYTHSISVYLDFREIRWKWNSSGWGGWWERDW